MSFNTFILQDPTEKHFGDVGILDKYEDNNNNKKNTFIQHIKSEKYRQLGFWKLSEIGIPCNPIHWFQFADDAAVISSQEKENQMLLNRATTKTRYSDTTIQRYRNRNLEPEPGTVQNLCKLEHFAPQEIYIIIIYRGGGGAQFNDNIQYYMQGILIFKQNKE
jgi:hypothetical protein